MRIPILAYQPTRIDGNEYPNNDLKALAADLKQVTDAGFEVRPLRSIVDAWLDNRGHELDGRIVGLMTSSGADFDYVDLPHPTAGTQRSVFNVLRDFRAAHPRKQKSLNVTSFVVASPEARSILDTACLLGKGWWSDNWWRDAVHSGLMHIGNHSWDYNHDKLPPSSLRAARGGTFETV